MIRYSSNTDDRLSSSRDHLRLVLTPNAQADHKKSSLSIADAPCLVLVISGYLVPYLTVRFQGEGTLRQAVSVKETLKDPVPGALRKLCGDFNSQLLQQGFPMEAF
jgi:hypothetical protein